MDPVAFRPDTLAALSRLGLALDEDIAVNVPTVTTNAFVGSCKLPTDQVGLNNHQEAHHGCD